MLVDGLVDHADRDPAREEHREEPRADERPQGGAASEPARPARALATQHPGRGQRERGQPCEREERRAPAALAELFDGPAFGTVAGVYQWAYALGGAGIGWFGAFLFGRSGSYVATFVIAIAAAAFWVLCLLYVTGAAARARIRPEPLQSTARGRFVGSLESEP